MGGCKCVHFAALNYSPCRVRTYELESGEAPEIKDTGTYLSHRKSGNEPRYFDMEHMVWFMLNERIDLQISIVGVV